VFKGSVLGEISSASHLVAGFITSGVEPSISCHSTNLGTIMGNDL
jgi:hypothetical protein